MAEGYFLGEEITLKIIGYVSPTENDLSHLFLVYDTGGSGDEWPFEAAKLGDFPVKFFLDADGTTYTYGPTASTPHQFTNINDNQTVYGYLQAFDNMGNYSLYLDF